MDAIEEPLAGPQTVQRLRHEDSLSRDHAGDVLWQNVQYFRHHNKITACFMCLRCICLIARYT